MTSPGWTRASRQEGCWRAAWWKVRKYSGMERGVVIVDPDDDDDEEEEEEEEGMWMPGGRMGLVEERGGKRIQYLRPERTAFQALRLMRMN